MSTLKKYHDSFYVYMLSNASQGLYPENTPSNFRNQLQVPLDFDSEVDKWEVGVSEIQMPNSFFNITKSNNWFEIRYPKSITDTTTRGRRLKRAAAVDNTKWSPPVIWKMKPDTFIDVEEFFAAMNNAEHEFKPGATK